MEELIKKLEELKDLELLNAYKQYGKHHSRHEAYAVLLEEVQETKKELDVLGYELSMVWDDIKQDKEKLRAIDEMLIIALNMAAEAVQVAAMVQKFIDYESNKKE